MYLEHSFFKKFCDVQYYKNIRPGQGKGDYKVTDIRGMQYTPNGEINYKIRFPHKWQNLPQKVNKNILAMDWSNLQQLHQNRRKITNRKYEDLQFLKSTLKKSHHKFYDDLPHE